MALSIFTSVRIFLFSVIPITEITGKMTSVILFQTSNLSVMLFAG